MILFQRNNAPFKLLVIFVVLALLNGCTSWTAQNRTPEEVANALEPGEGVHIKLRDGVDFHFKQPYLVGDSLAAKAGSYDSFPKLSKIKEEDRLFTVHPEYLAVALSDMERLEVKRTSPGKTIGLVGHSRLPVGRTARGQVGVLKLPPSICLGW